MAGFRICWSRNAVQPSRAPTLISAVQQKYRNLPDYSDDDYGFLLVVVITVMNAPLDRPETINIDMAASANDEARTQL